MSVHLAGVRIRVDKFLIPLYGISLFLLLYVVAAVLYPGGSNTSRVSEGFSLRYNYWCDLMSLTAKNGADNPGRPFAIAAWVILCISLSAIWIFLPRLFRFRDFQQKVIQYLGPISMGIAVFSYTDYHDTVVHLACAVGGIALLLTILEFRKGRYYDLLALALLCLLLEAGNVVLYTTNYQIWLLPMLQKVSYACYLFTFGVTGWRIYRHIKYEDQFRPV